MYEVDIHVFDCHDPHHGFHSNTVALAVGLLVAFSAAIFGTLLLYKFVFRRRIQRRSGGPTSMTSQSYSRVQDTRELIYHEENA